MRTDKLQRRNWIALQLPIAVLIGALGCGGTPVAPDSALGPTASSPTVAGYRVSGVVTDDTGTPISNASVILDHGPRLPDLNAGTQRLTTRTSANGSYSLFLRPELVQAGVEPFAMVRAYTFTNVQQHTANIQQVAPEGTSSIRNLRLSRVRVMGPSDSIAVSIDADSSLCDVGNVSLTTRCEWVRISYPDPGRITVEARPEAGGMVPIVRTSKNAGQGTLQLEGDEDFYDVDVAIQIPLGMAPQRFTVSTTVR